MITRSIHGYGLFSLLAAAFLLAPGLSAPARPAFDRIEKTARAALAERVGYRDGDLLSQEQAATALKALEKIGWKVAASAEIIAKIPTDKEPMAAALASKQGQQMMRRLKGDPQAFDRLDRLSQLPDGKQILRKLTHEPGGEKLVEYMMTPQGANMGRMLSNTKVRNFDKPTGKIYVEKQFVAALKAAHEAGQKPGAAAPPRK